MDGRHAGLLRRQHAPLGVDRGDLGLRRCPREFPWIRRLVFSIDAERAEFVFDAVADIERVAMQLDANRWLSLAVVVLLCGFAGPAPLAARKAAQRRELR